MPDQQLSSKGVSATTEPVKRKLPFDPISLVVRLLLAIYVPVFLGVGTGVFAYRTVKSRPPSFESSAVCLIDLKVQGMAQGYQPTSPSCIIGMFTLPSTFRRVASRLNGEYDAGELAGMVTVDHDRKSKMITVTATASSAEAAADLANAVIEVTGERIILDRFEASRQACTHFVKTEKELNERLQKVEQKLKELGEVDINVTVSQKQARLSNIDLELERLKIRQKGIGLRITGLNKIIKNLQVKLDNEKIQMDETMDNDFLRGKLHRYRQLINGSKDRDVLKARLDFALKDLRSVEALFNRGLNTRIEVEAKRRQYEVLLRMYEDTPEVEHWRDEIDKLDELVIPKKNKNRQSESAPIIKEFLLKAMELNLDKASIKQEVLDMEKVKYRAEKEVRDLPARAKLFLAMKREIGVIENLLFEIRVNKQRAMQVQDLMLSPFKVLDYAQPGIAGVGSRMVGIAGLAFGGFFMGFLGLLIWFVIRSNPCSLGGVRWLTSIPVAWKIRRFNKRMPMLDRVDAIHQAQLVFWERIGGGSEMNGKIIYVTGCGPGCGKSSMVEGLQKVALCYDFRPVVLRFAETACPEGFEDVTDAFLGVPEAMEQVDFTQGDCFFVNLEQITLFHLNSPACSQLLENARDAGAVLLLDGPDLQPGLEGSFLSRLSDMVFMVIGAGMHPRSKILESMRRISGENTRFVVVNLLKWPFTNAF